MFKQVDYIIIIVSDMKRSVEFYRDKLGIPLKFETNDWTEFQTGASTLALHRGGVPAQPAQGMEPQAGSCSVGFNVEDINATYRELSEKGVRFVMPPTQREGERIILTVAIDPDGLPVSFAQSLR